MKYKVLLAINHQGAEEAFKGRIQEMNSDYTVVGVVVHKDSVIDFIENNQVDILVIAERINGNEDIFKFLVNLKVKFPALRIVFLAATDRGPGDKYLAMLVTYQIYDILCGKQISITDMLLRTLKPATWEDASIYLPKNAKPDDIFDENELKEASGRIVKKSEEVNSTNIEVLSSDEEPVQLPKKEFGTSLKDRFTKKKTEITLKKEEVASNDVVEDFENPQIPINVIPDQSEELKEMRKKLQEAEERTKQAEIERERIEKEKIRIEKENQKVFKLNKQITEDYDKVRRELIDMDKSRNVSSKQKVVVFYGAMPGVGNTTAALNTATFLAMKGQKVMYIEFNDILPTLSYWFDFGDVQQGIEKAFLGIETRNYQDISKCILDKEGILNLKSDVRDKHAKLPDSLSFMFFSDNYIKSGESGGTNPNTLKDLLLFLLYKEGYDYVILDIYSHSNLNILETATIFSSINVFTMTQDVATIGMSMKKFIALRSNGLEFESLTDPTSKTIKSANYKNIYLINKYNEKIWFNKSKIKNWLEVEKLIYMPENSVDIINGLFKALPALLMTKNNDYKVSISNLVDLFG